MLTGLTNRSMFQEALEEALTLSRETGEAFALLSLDLDRFKAVNDLFGHAEGDRVLRDVAEILRSAICEGDVVARLGGDEFIILARRVGGADAYGALAERILAIFRNAWTCWPIRPLSASASASRFRRKTERTRRR